MEEHIKPFGTNSIQL